MKNALSALTLVILILTSTAARADHCYLSADGEQVFMAGSTGNSQLIRELCQQAEHAGWNATYEHELQPTNDELRKHFHYAPLSIVFQQKAIFIEDLRTATSKKLPKDAASATAISTMLKERLKASESRQEKRRLKGRKMVS